MPSSARLRLLSDPRATPPTPAPPPPNGHATATIDDIHRALSGWTPGTPVELHVLRNGELHTFAATPREARR